MIGGLIPLIILGGFIYAAVMGVRSLMANSPGAQPLDTAEVAKSFAIHVGLFVAMIGCAAGLIDLLQYFVEENDRLAGTNTDLARGMSLLIVSVPAFGLLLRAVGGRYTARHATGDSQPHRGWSVYLVAALTTSLVAALVSIVQITERITSDTQDFEPNELMQLIVWAAVWATHWFVLRPRFRVLGDAHLAIGTIIGLGWMLSGVGAVIFRILDSGYDALFNESLAGSFDTDFWVVVAIAGVIVWAWHWVAHFNVPGSVEGDRRKSPLWFFTAVVAGVLPGLIAMLVTATAAASGVLIWFFGTTDETAANYFEPTSVVIAVLFVGFVTWAYHRWELVRDGNPARNEALRFHDYVVVAVGLIGTVSATAGVMSLVIRALGANSYFAGTYSFGNAMIAVLTVLVAAAAVWWWYWSRIEGHRRQEPLAESTSIWRRLYLIGGFGVGGLVLSVSLIWVLFTFLRDLFDGQLGGNTLEDLTGPLGWAIAVVGGVWYHLGIWKVDRDVIAAHAPAMPPPPTPDSVRVAPTQLAAPAATSTTPPMADPASGEHGFTFRVATPADHGELFTLQRAASVGQAIAHNSLQVPHLAETFEQLQARLATSSTLLVTDGARIVGSVSAQWAQDDNVDIGPPIVAPDRPHEPLATALLEEMNNRLRQNSR